MNKDPKQEVDEELRFHLEQRTRDYIARGMSPEAAREAAAQRFGDTARVREACTSVLLAERAAEERRAFVRVSWLDVKLGLRMLAKYPGLSLVAVGGMAIAIAFGAGYFALVGSFLDSRVPIEGGDRVVMIRNRYVPGPDAAGTGRIGDVGPAAFDFRQWQDRVKSVVELSAFRDDKRNLITEDGQVQLVRVAAITASGLRLTRVPPLLGRTLLDEDERPGAPPVLVIAYEQWQRQFNADARILGRTVRLGDTPHTIVGVMPEGFAFPILHRMLGAAASHRARCESGWRSAPQRLRPDRRWVLALAGTSGAHRHRARDGRSLSAKSRHRPPGGRCIRAGVHRDRGARDAARLALAAVRRRTAAAHRRGERRDPRVCAHGDTLWRDRRANGARRHSRPRHHAAVRRSARAVDGCRRAGSHAAGHRVRDVPGLPEGLARSARLVALLDRACVCRRR